MQKLLMYIVGAKRFVNISHDYHTALAVAETLHVPVQAIRSRGIPGSG